MVIIFVNYNNHLLWCYHPPRCKYIEIILIFLCDNELMFFYVLLELFIYFQVKQNIIDAFSSTV